MKCTYENWLARKDEAIQNAQHAIERGDGFMADYWQNRAKFCEKILNDLLNQTADKWLRQNF